MDHHACSVHDLLKRPLLGCIAATLCMMGSGCAKVAEQKTQEGRHSFMPESASVAITTLAHELEENFVYPDIGAAYANALRAKVAAGAYSRFQTAADFATAELVGVEPDVKTTADHALDEALRRAGVNPVEGRKAVDALKR